MPIVNANGIDLYYEVQGAGEPLVLIAGLNSDHTLFTRTGLAAALAERYRVVLFDNRGVGRTAKPDAPYSIEMMADDTAALLDALDIDAAHVLGLSLGGRVALALALERPARVRSLILVSAGARTPLTLRGHMVRLQLHLRLVRRSVPYYAVRRQLDAVRAYDARARLGEIGLPTLILHGRSDRTAPLWLAHELQAGIAGATMTTFRGGHLFFILRRDAVVAAIAGFLAGVAEPAIAHGTPTASSQAY